MERESAPRPLDLDARLKDIDGHTCEGFHANPRVEIIGSLPGMGPILGTESIAIVGDLSR
ncbi:hypothetical protein [Actinomadura rugatobispora]|uniref:Uncharacterized protein n=1 Tax=Actinomadura rugatobispora TaxID=1994 RepID=A0ABW1AIC1_9ACTN|nr:hypothetical protein GCM10010200_082250 [Actinomadura rugatobispora]